MAHQVQPYHEPHDQLRTEAPRQKPQSDKYVSAFVSNNAEVDVTFRAALLPQSADNYKVGIDELTVNFSGLSMLEFTGSDSVLLRIVRLGNQYYNDGNVGLEEHADVGNFRMHNGPAGQPELWRDAFEFKVDRPYNTIQEVLGRFNEISRSVNNYIKAFGLQNAHPDGYYWYHPFDADVGADSAGRHLEFSVTSNGEFKIGGSAPFWANFAIEFPEDKYRSIFLRDTAKQYVSLHPLTGIERNNIYTVANGMNQGIKFFGDAGAPGAIDFAGATIFSPNAFEYVGKGNLLHTLDRRVTLEVGCSLPVKNSPMIDHGQEAPDFVLGRYMFHKPYTLEANGSGNYVVIASESLGVQTLQGLRDRIVYHHLSPQQKIQTFRLKLFARVRTFVNGKWGMATINCPVSDADYWHIRLHFASV